MRKLKLQTTEYSSSILQNLSKPTENLLFELADRLQEHYKSQVIRCSKDRAGNVILQTYSFVGVIDVGGELAIEIFPKIYQSNDTENLQNLFFMLTYSGKLDIPNKNLSALESFSGSFFESLIRIFAEELLDKVQNSAHKEYVTESNNKAYLRGKLLLTDHLKQNPTVANKFFTQTDEFVSDNKLNQVLKSVCASLLGLSSNRRNKELLRKCLDLYNDVRDVTVSYYDAERIVLNRLNARFENLLNLSKLFLKNQTLAAKSGLHSTLTVLIDMNELFECFVTEALKRGLKNSKYSVDCQGPRKNFVRNITDNRDVFTMKPDISIAHGDQIIKIADTKYKKLNQDDAKYGVSQSDLYQMFAYSRRYQTPDITLIYPMTNQVQSHTLELPDNSQVKIRQINLRRNIRQEIKQLEQEAVELLRSSY